jgi:hypothetical protein
MLARPFSFEGDQGRNVTVMKIQNPKQAGASISLRYARTEMGEPVRVTGDANGTFDVPERDAELLLTTPGWREPKQARQIGDDPAPAPEPTTPDPALVGGTDGEDGEDPPDDQDTEPEGPDLEKVRTKAEALALAEEYEVEGVTEDMRLADMKAALELAIYGEEE